MSEATPHPEPESFWDDLVYYINCAFAMFGAPEAIAEKGWLSRAAHAQMQSWLYRCEEFLRRLLFIDAITHHRACVVSSKLPERCEGAPAPRRVLVAADPARPETWRVSFALAASARPALACVAVAPKHEAATVVSALPLARRLEALRRALADRVRQGKRMARLLARRAVLALKYCAPTRTYQRNAGQPGDWAVAEVSVHCARLQAALPDSS